MKTASGSYLPLWKDCVELGGTAQMAGCSCKCGDRVRETDQHRRLKNWHPGTNISSSLTQSPLVCARASAALAEAEGWGYFDHQALFSEYTWLIPSPFSWMLFWMEKHYWKNKPLHWSCAQYFFPSLTDLSGLSLRSRCIEGLVPGSCCCWGWGSSL
jgi:hypothetical protein